MTVGVEMLVSLHSLVGRRKELIHHGFQIFLHFTDSDKMKMFEIYARNVKDMGALLKFNQMYRFCIGHRYILSVYRNRGNFSVTQVANYRLESIYCPKNAHPPDRVGSGPGPGRRLLVAGTGRNHGNSLILILKLLDIALQDTSNVKYLLSEMIEHIKEINFLKEIAIG